MLEESKSAAWAGRKVMLGALLVERGLLSAEQLSETLGEQARTGEYLGSILVRDGSSVSGM